MSFIRLTQIAATAAALLFGSPDSGRAQAPPAVRNIVLVHGAWADGSGWRDVHRILRMRGYAVSIVQNPLSSLADDVAATRRVLARQDGPVVLVAHSYGGMVITEAGDDDKVAGLVYVAAFMPEPGDSVRSINAALGRPPAPVQPSADGYLFFDPAAFPQAFAQDVPAEHAAFLADAQVPYGIAATAAPVTRAAWRSRPSAYVVTTEDRIIPPAAQRAWAARANATVTEVRGSHAVFVSQPEAVADAIDRAARAASR